SETLCTIFITLKEIYEGNCMNNSSIKLQRQLKCSFIYEFFHPHIHDCMNNSSI
ncbi:unnamed protein product, partial [Schistosoma guineensis]